MFLFASIISLRAADLRTMHKHVEDGTQPPNADIPLTNVSAEFASFAKESPMLAALGALSSDPRALEAVGVETEQGKSFGRISNTFAILKVQLLHKLTLEISEAVFS